MNDEGDTPLASACAGGDTDICKLLIAKGGDVNKNCIHAAVKLFVKLFPLGNRQVLDKNLLFFYFILAIVLLLLDF